ncbi:MAG: hypothetical protein FWE83_11470 [Oscillospiraceae bacterium]|nr:hypothetical protein [Oscillospiraceae bacterium]
MYKIIDNPKMMTKDEIYNAYNGKWVFIVKANITEHGRLVEGIPVILGDYQYDGIEDGIYDKYKGDEYEQIISYTLVPLNNTITSVFGVGLA